MIRRIDRAVCTRRPAQYHDDWTGGYYKAVWFADSMCPNRAGAPVYGYANTAVRIGTLDTTSSWFLCWTEGAMHSGGNNIWYYTQGDRVVSHPEWFAFGFVPAVHVFTTNDPGDSLLPHCPNSRNR